MVAVNVADVSWCLSRRVRASLNYGNYNQKCVLSALACVKVGGVCVGGGVKGCRTSIYSARGIASLRRRRRVRPLLH